MYPAKIQVKLYEILNQELSDYYVILVICHGKVYQNSGGEHV